MGPLDRLLAPPMVSVFSTRMTFLPSSPARMAVLAPETPAPITRTSQSLVSATSTCSEVFPGKTEAMSTLRALAQSLSAASSAIAGRGASVGAAATPSAAAAVPRAVPATKCWRVIFLAFMACSLLRISPGWRMGVAHPGGKARPRCGRPPADLVGHGYRP